MNTGIRPDNSTNPPRVEGSGEIVMCNCPYAALAQAHTTVTCAMNFAWFEGLLEGLGDAGLLAISRPAEGRCCVELQPGV